MERTDLPDEDIFWDGGPLNHDLYRIGLRSPEGPNGPVFELKGSARHVGVWNRALSGMEVASLTYQEFDMGIPDLVGYWALDEGLGTALFDQQGTLDATTLDDPEWIDSCPFADDDLDGYPSWSDCNDDDPAAHLSDGSSPSCSAVSCKQIYNGGLGWSNGLYWLDPDNTNPFEAYCDMLDDGGGWTLIMRAINDQFSYESSMWTSTLLEDENNFSFTTSGKSKYHAFNSVPFSEMRSSDPVLLSDSYVHMFAQTYTSALNLFSGPGISVTMGINTYFNTISTSNNQSFGCADHQDVGFNQMLYLGLDPVSSDPSCDHNGGARWGQRVNGNHDGAGNHTGQGWGAYSTICAPYSSDGSSDPLCETDLFHIEQLLWIR